MPVLVHRVVCLLVCVIVAFYFLCPGLGLLHLGCALFSRTEGSYFFVCVVWVFGLIAVLCCVVCGLRPFYVVSVFALFTCHRMSLRRTLLNIISVCGSGRAFLASSIDYIA